VRVSWSQVINGSSLRLYYSPCPRIREPLYCAAGNALQPKDTEATPSASASAPTGSVAALDLKSILRCMVALESEPLCLRDVQWLQECVAEFNSNGRYKPGLGASTPPLPQAGVGTSAPLEGDSPALPLQIPIVIMMLPCFLDAYDDTGRPVRALTCNEVLRSALEPGVPGLSLPDHCFSQLHLAMIEHNSIVHMDVHWHRDDDDGLGGCRQPADAYVGTMTRTLPVDFMLESPMGQDAGEDAPWDSSGAAEPVTGSHGDLDEVEGGDTMHPMPVAPADLLPWVRFTP
jgi:hypothetical protein